MYILSSTRHSPEKRCFQDTRTRSHTTVSSLCLADIIASFGVSDKEIKNIQKRLFRETINVCLRIKLTENGDNGIDRRAIL